MDPVPARSGLRGRPLVGGRRAEFIPFFREEKTFRKSVHAREVEILDFDRGALHRGMDVKHVSDHLRIPRPFVFSIRRAVHANETAASFDVALECGLLLIVQHIAVGERHKLYRYSHSRQ